MDEKVDFVPSGDSMRDSTIYWRELRADAERYRWFRENFGVEYDGPNSLKLYTLINSRFRRGLSEPAGFDAAIDGAMYGTQKEKG